MPLPVRYIVVLALLLIGGAALVLHWQWPAASVPAAESRGPLAVPAPMADPAPGMPPPAKPLAMPAPPVLPMLADTQVDGDLRTDAAGNLQLALGVRDYFDYFLSAADQAGLDKAVEALLADAGARLQEPALGQLIGLLGDYLDYKRASLALLQQPLGAARQADPQAQLATLQQAFDSLAQLRRVHFSAAAVEALFGAEEAYARYTLDSLALLGRDELGESARIQAQQRLREQLPATLRASEERQSQLQARQAQGERLWQEGASEEQVRQFLALTYDPPTVEQLLAEQRHERAWRGRYAAYREELASLQGEGLSPLDLRREQQRLRQRLFAAEDLHRVDTYDAIAAKPLDAAGSRP